MTAELVEFLRARLAEDEQVARAAEGHMVFDGTGIVIHEGHLPSQRRTATLPSHVATFIARHDPARVLREVEAKRLILDLHGRSHECSTLDKGGEVDHCTWVLKPEECTTLRALALPYDQHPDYQESWRP